MPAQRKEIATVLVCEDEEQTRDLLCSRLTLDRFRVLPAETAADGLRCAGYDEPDIVLLDISLPDLSGLEVLRAIRADDEVGPRLDPDVPVIVLTGFGAEEDRIRGLTEGADDYIVKPFAYGELLARIRNVLRRGRPRIAPRLQAGEVTIDRRRHVATFRGEPCALSRKEFELLSMLAGDPHRVFTKRELLEAIWGYDELDQTRTLDAHASRLRRKLDPEGGRYVINVWSVGYKLMEP